MASLLVVAGLEIGVVVAGSGHLAGTVAPEVEVVVGLDFVAPLPRPELALAGAVAEQQLFGPVAGSASVVDSFDPVVLDFPPVLELGAALPSVVRSFAVDAGMS